VSPPNRLRASPKYSPELLHGTGRALLIGVLDLYDANPWSRLPESPYASLEVRTPALRASPHLPHHSLADHCPPFFRAKVYFVSSNLSL
jgi:hypothetical protein